jgi:hypothetical protein
VGQGVEGHHDVWRGAPYQTFDGIRIRDVRTKGSAITIEAELAAAYPKVPSLSTFTRTLEFDGAATFTISDRFTLKESSSIEWRLQSDTPFEARSAVQRNGGTLGAAIEVSVTEPNGIEIARTVGKLKAPGRPGSITEGPEEDRGYVLVGTTKAPAGESRIEATLRIVR